MTLEGRVPQLQKLIDTHWSAPGSTAYSDVAAKLRDLAARASSDDVRRQFAQLAALYEELACKSAQLADTYLPMDLSAADPAV